MCEKPSTALHILEAEFTGHWTFQKLKVLVLYLKYYTSTVTIKNTDSS